MEETSEGSESQNTTTFPETRRREKRRFTPRAAYHFLKASTSFLCFFAFSSRHIFQPFRLQPYGLFPLLVFRMKKTNNKTHP